MSKVQREKLILPRCENKHCVTESTMSRRSATRCEASSGEFRSKHGSHQAASRARPTASLDVSFSTQQVFIRQQWTKKCGGLRWPIAFKLFFFKGNVLSYRYLIFNFQPNPSKFCYKVTLNFSSKKNRSSVFKVVSRN